jgi:tetratricopeptide (TPR) repeat protein
MKNKKANDELDILIDEIIVDAYGDDEQSWAFRQVLEDELELPKETFVIGEPVTVLTLDYENERRGITARCRREDGTEYQVAACDLFFPRSTTAARYVAAYRKWLGIEPYPKSNIPTKHKPKKATQDDLDLTRDMELIALAVKGNAISCRIPGKGHVTLRSTRSWDVVPGELITVTPHKKWRYAGHPYLSGEIKSWRLDVAALGLTPLTLEDEGMWLPNEEYWGEPDKPLEDWEKQIIKRGPRLAYEMEQIIPGEDPDDPDTDPILESVELKESGDYGEARRTLMNLLLADLRCLDAHAHLGNLAFDHEPEKAIRHYEVGVRIGELSLGENFDGLLPWGHSNNRPFLRCLNGSGLCLWRLGRFKEADAVFTRMLWLNPADNQGVRGIIDDVRNGEPWYEQ